MNKESREILIGAGTGAIVVGLMLAIVVAAATLRSHEERLQVLDLKVSRSQLNLQVISLQQQMVQLQAELVELEQLLVLEQVVERLQVQMAQLSQQNPPSVQQFHLNQPGATVRLWVDGSGKIRWALSSP